MSDRVRKRVHDREDAFTSMDDESLLIGQSGIENLPKDARTVDASTTTVLDDDSVETGDVVRAPTGPDVVDHGPRRIELMIDPEQ